MLAIKLVLFVGVLQSLMIEEIVAGVDFDDSTAMFQRSLRVIYGMVLVLGAHPSSYTQFCGVFIFTPPNTPSQTTLYWKHLAE